LYESLDSLVDQTLALLAMSASQKELLGKAASRRAREFGADIFDRTFQQLTSTINSRFTSNEDLSRTLTGRAA